MIFLPKNKNCLAPTFAAFLNIAGISQIQCLGVQNTRNKEMKKMDQSKNIL